MENFYKPKTAEQREKALRGNYNLDHPSAFDEKLLFKTLEDLLNGQTVKVKTNKDKQNSLNYF
jgi:uridine kinase